MKFRKKYSFWQQLMGAVVVLMVVFLTLFLAVFQWMKRVVIEQYTASAVQSVDAVAQNIDYILRDIEVLSDSVLTNYDLINGIKDADVEQIRSNLNGAFISNAHVEGIYTLTESGYQWVGAQMGNGIWEFPKKALEDTGGEIVWFPTQERLIRILSGNVRKEYFSMGRKIIDVNSLEELGYLNIQVNEWQIQESYSDIKDAQSRVILCTREGAVVSDSEDLLPEAYIKELADAQPLLNKGETVSREYEIDGIPYVTISAACNGGEWRLIKAVPRSVLYGPVNRIQLYVMAGGALLLLLSVISAYWYSRRLAKPITVLQNSMKEVEQGNMAIQVDVQVHNELDDLGGSFNHMVRRLKELMEEVVTAEKQRNELELEVLHAQINPHFLYNTLNTIRWMAKIKGEESISTAIVALVKLLRVSISLGKNMITLEEEAEYVQNYITIQRLRFNQSFQVEFDILPHHEKLTLPKLILQPIVENSLIYGLDEEEEAIRELEIRIFTREKGDYVEIVVEDNGPGISREIQEKIFREEKNINKFSKVGLNNINQRIKMYFGEEYGLEILSEESRGTSISIVVPKEEGRADV